LIAALAFLWIAYTLSMRNHGVIFINVNYYYPSEWAP